MGHLAGKDIYGKLGHKIDGLSMRAPWNRTLYAILKELYTAEEAELLVKMPYGFSTFSQVQKITRYPPSRLQKLLDGLSSKGLVMDIKMRDTFRYMISPMVIGIFEYTMMRTDRYIDSKKMAKLFNGYLLGDPGFHQANFKRDFKVSFARALPYRDSIAPSQHAEILDYEKAGAIIENSKDFCVGICSCRHEKLHIGEKTCDIPLEKCSTFGLGADYLIRHNLAKKASKTQMLENLDHSRENGLVLCSENVQKNVSFICHCCGCCCNLLLGISKLGYPNAVITSSFIARIDSSLCKDCGKCAQSCPINAIIMQKSQEPERKQKNFPFVDKSICLGCGVCSLHCTTGALKLVKRQGRILLPANTFERLILQCLERGTLQNQIFKDPQKLSHAFMRGFIGGFLNLKPVKRAILSDILRSRFFTTIKKVI